MIVQQSAWLATVVKCEHCPHTIPSDSTIEWVDTDGTVFFVGNSVLDLRVFLTVHDDDSDSEPEYLERVVSRILVKNPAVLVCKCGHPSSDHSFYSETRSECHGGGVAAGDVSCECSYYNPAGK